MAKKVIYTKIESIGDIKLLEGIRILKFLKQGLMKRVSEEIPFDETYTIELSWVKNAEGYVGKIEFEKVEKAKPRTLKEKIRFILETLK